MAVEAIAGHKAVFEPLAIPAVVFTDPEIAWCGLTEAQAKQRAGDRGGEVPVGRVEPRHHVDRPDGLTKLVLEPRPGGCSASGSSARGRRADCRGRAGHRDGRDRRRPQADDPSAPDAVGDPDGERRGVLRPEHARLQAEAEISRAAIDRSAILPRTSTIDCRRQEIGGLHRHGSCTRVRHGRHGEPAAFCSRPILSPPVFAQGRGGGPAGPRLQRLQDEGAADPDRGAEGQRALHRVSRAWRRERLSRAACRRAATRTPKINRAGISIACRGWWCRAIR